MKSLAAAAAAKSLQLCPTLCDPIDGLLPGSSVPGILQARTLEWVVISFSNAWKWKVKMKSLSCVRFFATLCQAPLSLEFSRQEYWSRLPSPTLGHLSDPCLLHFLHWPGSFFTTATWDTPLNGLPNLLDISKGTWLMTYKWIICVVQVRGQQTFA